jgi:hypothetical protein
VSPVADVLRRAAERVRHGWCQGSATRTDADGRTVAWCAWGAIYHSCAWKSSATAYNAARELFITRLEGREIGEWNDAPERTQGEVVAALLAAADAAERGA